MKVIEGKQVALSACRAATLQTPRYIPTTEHAAEPLAPVSIPAVRPRKAGVSSRLRELHIENTQAQNAELLPKTALTSVHMEAAKPDVVSMRSGQREMTLEELFKIGRKEEEK